MRTGENCMSTIMALDGGGTKTLAILFDEDLNLLGMAAAAE